MNTSYPLRILLLALGVLGGLAKARAAMEEIKPNAQGAAVKETSPGIDEKGYVSIGGIPQWVTIKGRNRANPVVLFVHGGPGNPMSQYAEALYKDWEGDFTIVHWDQRGSGKTFEANQTSGELTMESLNATDLSLALIVRDGLAVAEYARQKLGQDRVILTGTSWGSAVAVYMVRERPELFRCYVGLSQMVNYQRGLVRSYERVLAKARALGDTAAVGRLESLGAPPWKNPRAFGQLRRVSRQYEAQVTDRELVLVSSPEHTTEQARAAYASGEEFSFVKFVGMTGEGMGNDVVLDENAVELPVPVYLIQGTEDLVTVPEITERYFAQLKAPAKQLIRVEKCGHDPNQRMREVQFEVLKAAAQASARGKSG
jgi:pimeloyl-ACP methyl ester carboxylesterase